MFVNPVFKLIRLGSEMLDDFSKQIHERARMGPPVLPSLLEGVSALAPAPARIK